MPEFAATRVSSKIWVNRHQFHKKNLVPGLLGSSLMMSNTSVSRMVWPSEPLSSDSAGIWVRLMSAISSSGHHRNLCTVRNLDTTSTFKCLVQFAGRQSRQFLTSVVQDWVEQCHWIGLPTHSLSSHSIGQINITIGFVRHPNTFRLHRLMFLSLQVQALSDDLMNN